jgi:ketosteroid isomerase-like protein
MSEETVELAREGFKLWQRGDAEAFLSLIDPQVEWDLSAYPVPGVEPRGSGVDGLVRMFAAYLSGWNEYRLEAKEFIDAGDTVIAMLHETVRVGDSSDTLQRDVPYVWTFRDGRLCRFRVFQSKQEALEAAGLRE